MRFSFLVACWLVGSLLTSEWVTSPLWGKIAFHSNRDGNWEVYVMNSDGSHQHRLTFSEAADADPVWSPNGRQIAFMSKRDGNWEVYVMDADGKHPRRLTHHPGIDAEPDWSPDGSQIVFMSDRNIINEDHFFNLFVMDADGSNVKQVTDLGFGTNPMWSPDGEWLLFRGREIYACRTDGTDLWKVTPPKPAISMSLGGWSPDGKQVLYTEAIKSNVNTAIPFIALLAPRGRAEVIQWKRIKLPQLAIKAVSFSADGKSILFAGTQPFAGAEERGDWNIYRFGLVGKELTQLTNNQGDNNSGPREWNSRLSISPQRLTPTQWGEIKGTKLPLELTR